MGPYTHDERRETVAIHAWETWTKNGLNLDAEAIEETLKSVRDAAANVYVDDIDDGAWLDATLARLRGEG